MPNDNWRDMIIASMAALATLISRSAFDVIAEVCGL